MFILLIGIAIALFEPAHAVGVSRSLLEASEPASDRTIPMHKSTTGFYPLWENTGIVERHRDLRIGTTGAHFGVLDRLHIGVQPIGFLYRIPNAYIKVKLLESGSWSIAGQVNLYYLLEGAGRASFSPMYPSRLDNYDFTIYLIPLSLSATYAGLDWLAIHQTFTLLPLFTSGPLKNEVFPGYVLSLELGANSRHAAMIHLGEVGFWKHDFVLTGISYRYRNTWFEFRLGYFYRFTEVGTQGSPLIGIGILL